MTSTLQKPTDQRIVIQGTWEKFKLIQQASADSPGIRLAYFDGTIEILMPGQEHEFFKSIIGMLIEQFFLSMEIEFAPTGSMTQEAQEVASAQADESYCIGQSKPIPDLSIEVVFSSGGTNKLARYRAIGVPEVWFWQDGVFSLHRLRSNGYEQIDRSELPELAALDLELLSRCVLMAETSRLEAIRAFRKSL
ncbi:MAG TPA: Uma2 family endonuclease [Coleofasciculaceae cyanobacterium]|jgi:Uma2 family endonuclease